MGIRMSTTSQPQPQPQPQPHPKLQQCTASSPLPASSSSSPPPPPQAVVKPTDGLEPRFSLPATTPRSSRTDIVIGGIRVYVYGLAELQRKSGVEVAVLHLAHNRKRSYLVTEDIAFEVLHRYRTQQGEREEKGEKGRTRRRMELIAVTINMRNHGEREVSPQANLTWEDGNEQHGMDLLSMISGSAQDFKLIMDYLPSYLPQFTHLHNVMAGVSLGGHTAWRMASLVDPNQIEAYAMVVGCPTLGELLLSRLGISEEMSHSSYDDLSKVMTETQRRRWPRELHKLVMQDDRKLADVFPSDVPVLLCNGAVDPLVPPQYTSDWVEKRKQKQKLDESVIDENMRLFVQENTGHSCTKEMVALIAEWLGGLFQEPE